MKRWRWEDGNRAGQYPEVETGVCAHSEAQRLRWWAKKSYDSRGEADVTGRLNTGPSVEDWDSNLPACDSTLFKCVCMCVKGIQVSGHSSERGRPQRIPIRPPTLQRRGETHYCLFFCGKVCWDAWWFRREWKTGREGIHTETTRSLTVSGRFLSLSSSLSKHWFRILFSDMHITCKHTQETFLTSEGNINTTFQECHTLSKWNTVWHFVL